MFRNWNKLSILYSVLATAIVFVSFFCICNATLFGEGLNKLTPLPTLIPYVGFLVANVIACVLFTLGAIKSKYHPNMIFLCIFVFVFALDMISTFRIGRSILLDNPKFGPQEYQLPNESLLCILQFFLVLLVFFILIDFLPKVCQSSTLVDLLSLLMIAIVGVFVIISYFTDSSHYIAIIKSIPEPDYNIFKCNSVSSIIVNPNPFSFLLFIAMISSSLLHFRTGKWWWILPMAYFFLHIPFTFCRATIAIAAIYFIGYFIIRFIFTFKQNKRRNILTISIVGSSLILCLTGLIVAECVNQWVSKLFRALNANIDDLSGRLDLWDASLKLLVQHDLGHGFGFKMFDYVLERYMNGGPTPYNGASVHNGYLDYICSNGIVFGLVAIFFYVILFRRTIKTLRYERQIGVLTLLLIACGMSFSMFENGRICFASNIEYTVLSAFIWIPVSKNLVFDFKN